jgi:hypothetical protein
MGIFDAFFGRTRGTDVFDDVFEDALRNIRAQASKRAVVESLSNRSHSAVVDEILRVKERKMRDNKGQLFAVYEAVNGYMAEFPSGAVVVGSALSDCLTAASAYVARQIVEGEGRPAVDPKEWTKTPKDLFKIALSSV